MIQRSTCVFNHRKFPSSHKFDSLYSLFGFTNMVATSTSNRQIIFICTLQTTQQTTWSNNHTNDKLLFITMIVKHESYSCTSKYQIKTMAQSGSKQWHNPKLSVIIHCPCPERSTNDVILKYMQSCFSQGMPHMSHTVVLGCLCHSKHRGGVLLPVR